MRLTLTSLQAEMRGSFAAMSLRIDNLDTNLHERADHILLSLDKHMKDTAYRFREVDRRFEAVDQRFEQIDRRFDAIDRRFDAIDQRFMIVDQNFKTVQEQFKQQTRDIIDALFPFFTSVEQILNKHENRITILEASSTRSK